MWRGMILLFLLSRAASRWPLRAPFVVCSLRGTALAVGTAPRPVSRPPRPVGKIAPLRPRIIAPPPSTFSTAVWCPSRFSTWSAATHHIHVTIRLFLRQHQNCGIFFQMIWEQHMILNRKLTKVPWQGQPFQLFLTAISSPFAQGGVLPNMQAVLIHKKSRIRNRRSTRRYRHRLLILALVSQPLCPGKIRDRLVLFITPYLGF
jgi:hypothetical protein